MINKIKIIKNLISDEKKEILFINKLSDKNMDIYLKRIEKDIYIFHKYSLSKIISSILPDIDNIEKSIALSKLDKKFQLIYIELKNILKLVMNVLNKYHVTTIYNTNVLLDPSIHQAISVSSSTTIQKNYIIEVMQKGYKLYKRVLRPAMVIVSQ
ncbi:nucleotide exchange factor GrpE [Buchnera aphidicola]|uniref:nucleotide exchange factor GrpE n=1 Tax=Buchnera aphidicola TaxID=9 RepID=UPI003463A5EB